MNMKQLKEWIEILTKYSRSESNFTALLTFPMLGRCWKWSHKVPQYSLKNLHGMFLLVTVVSLSSRAIRCI